MYKIRICVLDIATSTSHKFDFSSFSLLSECAVAFVIIRIAIKAEWAEGGGGKRAREQNRSNPFAQT